MSLGAGALMGAAGGATIAGSAVAATMTAAFVGGVVGSAASQVVGKAMGAVEHFSLRQAVGSGLTAAATAGMGAMASSAGAPAWAKSAATFMKGSGALNYAARGAFSYMNSYAAQKITGQQASFSWGGVAASAAGSMVGNSLADGLSIGEPSVDGFIRSVSVGGSTGLANRLLNKGGKVDWVRIATDAFANEIGNSIVQSQFEASYSGEAFNERATAGTAAALDGSTRHRQDADLNRRAANTDTALNNNTDHQMTVYASDLARQQGMADAAAQSLYMTRLTDRLTAARQGDAHQAKLNADLMNRKAQMEARRTADAARAQAFGSSDAVMRGMAAAAGQGYHGGMNFGALAGRDPKAIGEILRAGGGGDVQTALDVIGMTDIPVVSQLADIASGTISLYRGDYVGAGLSYAAVVPVIGNAAAMAKMGRHADVAADVLRVGDTTNNVPELVEGAYSLVGANRAVIDPRKLTDYALNPAHPVGGGKARVFESALGFNQSNADDLLAQLQRGVMENTPIPGKIDQFGTRFTVDIPVVGPAGAGAVRTGWIYKVNSMTPELTTLFVK